MKKSILTAVLLALLIPFTALAQTDNEAKNLCLKEARQENRDAIKEANLNLKLSSLACKFEPTVAACAGVCFQNFRECIEPVNDSLQGCRKSCFETLVATRASLRQQFGCTGECGSNLDFQVAMVQANLAYHSCRINCRGDETNLGARAACRTVHSSCVKDCKNAN